MWRGVFLLNETEILAMTYLDICKIERYDDTEDPETGITIQGWKTVLDNIPCAFSQKSSSNALPVVDGTGNVNVTFEEQSLFVTPDIEIIKGDKITIMQSTGHISVLYAKKPFYYPSHAEISLTGSDIDG